MLSLSFPDFYTFVAAFVSHIVFYFFFILRHSLPLSQAAGNPGA